MECYTAAKVYYRNFHGIGLKKARKDNTQMPVVERCMKGVCEVLRA